MVHVIKQNTTGKNVEVNAVKLYLISVIKAEFVASLLQSSVDSCSPVTCDQWDDSVVDSEDTVDLLTLRWTEREKAWFITRSIYYSSSLLTGSPPPASSLFFPLAFQDPHYSYITTYKHSDEWIVLSAIENIVFSLYNNSAHIQWVLESIQTPVKFVTLCYIAAIC